MAAAQKAAQPSEIENLVATLAGRQHDGPKAARQLSGPERAAVLMLALGEQHGAKIWNLLDDDDLRQLSIVMSTLGNVDSQMVEALLLEFVGEADGTAAPRLAETRPEGRELARLWDQLVAALSTGRIAGAAVDVVDTEPLPADSALWRAPHVLITPHVAADTAASAEQRKVLVQENLRRYVAGEALLAVVDPARGY